MKITKNKKRLLKKISLLTYFLLLISLINISEFTVFDANAASNTVNTTTYEASSIEQHGIYSGSSGGNLIVGSNNVTNGIPMTMAMIVDAGSLNPKINWSVDDNTKIIVDNTSFKEYKIADDGTIGIATSLTIDDSGNITGISMENGKRYLIVYSITPVTTGTVKLTATSDETSSKYVNLTIGAQPDLF